MVVSLGFRADISTLLDTLAQTYSSCFPLNRLRLHLDVGKKPVLHIVQDRVVLNHGKVLSLTEELLVRVNTGAKHLLALLRSHLTHLLGHLVRG
jgi:urease accessory protein UreE